MITHSVRSMYQLYVVCMGICMWYFAKLITLSTCIAVFPWDLDTMILEKSHTCDLNRHEVIINVLSLKILAGYMCVR